MTTVQTSITLTHRHTTLSYHRELSFGQAAGAQKEVGGQRIQGNSALRRADGPAQSLGRLKCIKTPI